MIHLLALQTPVTITFTALPAAKVVAAFILIYTAMAALKKVPAFTPYLNGWVSIAVNIILAVASLFVPPSGITASQLYTTSTAMAVLNAILTAMTTSAAAAGMHGTLKSLSKPTVLATVPPDPQAKEVPATLVPDNPAAVPVEKK